MFALVDDYKTVLREAWSVKAWALSSICQMSGVAVSLLPVLQGSVNPWTLFGLGLFFGLLGIVARFLQQPEIHGASE